MAACIFRIGQKDDLKVWGERKQEIPVLVDNIVPDYCPSLF